MLYEQIQSAIAYIRTRTDFQPRTGIILGTGLGQLTEDVEEVASVDYSDIPHFARSTVESHQGRLVFGRLEGHPIVVMAGRFHYYEGWTMQQVTFPVRVLGALGIERLFITNVSGGVNPHLRAGDLVVGGLDAVAQADGGDTAVFVAGPGVHGHGVGVVDE